MGQMFLNSVKGTVPGLANDVRDKGDYVIVYPNDTSDEGYSVIEKLLSQRFQRVNRASSGGVRVYIQDKHSESFSERRPGIKRNRI